MRPVYADTSFYLALLNPREKWHRESLQVFAQLHSPVVTSEYVLLELGAMLAKPSKRAHFLELIEEIRGGEADIIWANRFSFDAGLVRFAGRADKKWSLTDCISFSIMDEYGITEVLSTDRDFAQAGYRMLIECD